LSAGSERAAASREVLAEYPDLEREDVLQALRYALWLAEDREVTLPRA